ncbi:MAG TPA: hypothetical protein VFV14_09365 [Myxococcaceae bacterium]|nr:hypothetical protein [Myxococcaceae bacterium]
MKSPVLLRRFTAIRTQATQDWAEKLLADSLRLLGQCCAKLADAVEAQRLARAGYTQQDEFLERTDPGTTSKPQK